MVLIRPADANGLDRQGQPRVWLRICQGLEPVEGRNAALDLALALAITLALIRGAASATPLARRVVKTLERSLRRLWEFEQDASQELRGLLAAIAARVVHAHGGNRCVANAAGSGSVSR